MTNGNINYICHVNNPRQLRHWESPSNLYQILPVSQIFFYIIFFSLISI